MKVKVTVINKVAHLALPYPQEKLLPFWSYSVPNFHFIQRYYPHWDGKIKLLKRDRVPAGVFWATRKDIEASTDIKFKVRREYDKPVVVGKTEKTEGKYEFQDACVRKMVKRFRRGKGGLILNATGSGKTAIAAKFFKRINGQGIFIVDQLNLLKQARRDLSKWLGEKVGYVGNSKFKLKRITVATVQTLASRKDKPQVRHWLSKIEAVFVDEIHEQLNKREASILAQLDRAPTFGLTATLEMKKKNVRLMAFALTGPVVFEYPLQTGMKDKVLAGGVVVRVRYQNDIPFFARKQTKKEHIYREYIVENPERNAIITQIARYGYKKGYYEIVHLIRLDHMRRLSNRLNKKDVEHKLVAGTVRGKAMKVEEREKATKKFDEGKLRVLITNKVMKKGVDIKRVDMMIDGAGMRSKNDAMQKFGRGIRLHDEKKGLLYFDIADFDVKPQRYTVQEGKHKGEKRLRYHSYDKGSKERRAAYKAAGLRVVDFIWGEDGEAKELFALAKATLKKELKENGSR